VFSTPSPFWYIWFTLAHFTFCTPVGTLSTGTAVAFGTLRTASVFSILVSFGTFGAFGTLAVL